MKASDFIGKFLLFIGVMVLQVLWVKEFVFLNVAFCFLYLNFLLGLPIEIPTPVILLIGFFTGLIVDLFYDTLGIGAAACTALIFFRPLIITLLTPLGGYDNESDISINAMGIRWYITYVVIMVFLHHSIYFIIEAWNFDIFWWTTIKIISSTLFSSFMIIALEYLVLTRNVRRSR